MNTVFLPRENYTVIKIYALYSSEIKKQSSSQQNFKESYYGACIDLPTWASLLCYLVFFQWTYQFKENAEDTALSILQQKWLWFNWRLYHPIFLIEVLGVS